MDKSVPLSASPVAVASPEWKSMVEHWSDKEIELIASRIKAVAHPLRLAMVCLLGDRELTVNEICQAIGTTQPNVSQHLSLLHDQHLLTSRKEANRVYYSIGDRRLGEIIGMLQGIYCA